MNQLTPRQLQDWLADGSRPPPVLIDVREPWEFQICSLRESLHVPMNAIPGRAQELDPDADTVLICHHGSRSFQVGVFLERTGFARVFNLDGGLAAWAAQVDPAMPTY